MKVRDGAFVLSQATQIVYSKGLGETARLAAEQLGLSGTIIKIEPQDDAVNLLLDSALTPEGYRLDSAAGVFYGVQTLRQRHIEARP
jgi:hypothetical protein